MSRAQLQKYLDGSQAGKSLMSGRMSGKRTLKRNCDTRLSSVASLKAKEDVESTNTKRLRRSAVRSAAARKGSPMKGKDVETIDFDADELLEDNNFIPAPL